jgi:hypothetical protein
MSVRRVGDESKPPPKVLIPDDVFLGDDDEQEMRSIVERYYYIRDMMWNMIFIEEINPYTQTPYFILPEESAFNYHDWKHIDVAGEFRYTINFRLPSKEYGVNVFCELCIVYNFRNRDQKTKFDDGIDIHVIVHRYRNIKASPPLRLPSSYFYELMSVHHKNLLCVWFSSINNAYNVLFADTNRPSTWYPVIEYADRQCDRFINFVRDQNRIHQNEMRHTFLSRRRNPIPSSFPYIQQRDIARMIFNNVEWEEIPVPFDIMRQLCLNL